MPKSDVFLSYNRVDVALVEDLKNVLGSRGVTTFLDKDDLRPGLPWWEGWRNPCAPRARREKEEKAGRRFPVIPVLLPGSGR